jgi:hypothetical protein
MLSISPLRAFRAGAEELRTDMIARPAWRTMAAKWRRFLA